MASNIQNNSSRDNGIYIVNYLFLWLSGLVVFFIAGSSRRLKTHAAQAIILGVIAFILGFIPVAGPVIVFLIWAYGMYIGYMAYKGTDVMVPGIGDYAKKLAS
ncbi:MAG: hypothetical protein ACP5UH_00645 [Candidatus Micrarchaeia archaeon]